jgi:hypothetical protein
MVLRNLVTTPARETRGLHLQAHAKCDGQSQGDVGQDYSNNFGQAPLYFVFQHASSSPSFPRLNTCRGSLNIRPGFSLSAFPYNQYKPINQCVSRRTL